MARRITTDIFITYILNSDDDNILARLQDPTNPIASDWTATISTEHDRQFYRL